MAPTKKSKSVNKGFASTSDSSPTKDEKAKQKKRKLSDMLGPQWSKHEIERFYEAYRKHGQDWKKVAGVVRSRSIEMVEALYNMNRAYLSLPEGTASVVGLIAMMTDHYNVLGGTGGEKDSEEPEPVARKIQKNSKAKGLNFSRDDSRHQTAGSNDRCLSLLKTKSDGIQPRFPVRKRTPRVPVSCLDIHSNEKSRVSVTNANENRIPLGDSVSKEARKIPNSPLGSHTTYKKPGDSRTSHITREDAVPKFQVRKAKNGSFAVGEKSNEGDLRRNEASNGNLAWNSVDSGGSALAEYKKGRKGKKEDVQHSEATLFDEIREAYEYAEKGSRSNGFDGKGAKICTSTSEGQRKKRKKVTSEDELAACDALQTLAELSSMMPFLDADTVEAGESRTRQDIIGDKVGQSNVALSDEKVGGEVKEKCISQASKVQMAEACDYSSKPGENESVADEEVKSADSSGHASAVSKRCNLSLVSPDVSSSNDLRGGEMEVAASSTQVYAASQVVNSTRRKCRRKKDRTFHLKDRNYAPSGHSSDVLPLLQDRLLDIKGKLLHCLSCHEVRRWCVYEWFYSAIDYPWFAKREFVDYLNHVGLGHIPKLTRVELGVIRSSLGKPRRFSERFLQVERGKLEQYRDSVRTHYVRAGRGEGLPTDLACPLKVGQQVLAIHPKTRECHNGSVLTVDRDNYLVQFHRPDLGVEPVMDIDCMPLNPLENMPEALRKQKMALDYRCLQVPKANGSIIAASQEHMKGADHYLHVSSLSPSIPSDIEAKPACLSTHAKVISNGNFKAASAMLNQSHKTAQMHMQGQMRPIPGLTGNVDRKNSDQHSSCPENTRWPLPVIDSVGLNGTMHSSNAAMFSCQETASNVADIVEGSKDKAHKMVATAIKAISRVKEGEDAFGRIIDALNANNKTDYTTNCRMSTLMSSNTNWGSLPHQNPVTSGASEPHLAYGGLNMQSVGDSAPNDFGVPCDLISSCVATLLIVQTCSERQYPPAEVAQILDSAVTSLLPCCPQNLPLYRDIQMCMGRVKTQILALVPT